MNFFNECLEKLENIKKENTYLGASPFPHMIIDDFLPEKIIQQLVEEFPANDDKIWDRVNNKSIQVKLRSNWVSFSDVQPTTLSLINFLNSGPVLKLIAEISNIKHLISDPYLTGGGLNLMERDGHLAIHSDGNWHDDMQLHRRLNVILFLNKDWKKEWKGDLEFWDKDLTQCQKAIAPIYNRLAVFTTHDYTFHGVPQYIKCPKNQGRKSVIQYYYTSAKRPIEEVEIETPHRAIWKNKVEENIQY